MKYTVEHKNFTLIIREIQEENQDVYYEGICEKLHFSQMEKYDSGFWKLVGAFKYEVDDYLTPKVLHSESYPNGKTAFIFLVDKEEVLEDRKVVVHFNIADLIKLRNIINDYLES